MDYTYVACTTPQACQSLGFGAEDTPWRSVTNQAPNATLMTGNHDYSLNSTFGGNTGLSPLPKGSSSLPDQELSLLHNESVDGAIALDIEELPQGRSSGSEEKEPLTPAKSRRKAQNRAAQRAYRERKNRRVQDLETKLNALAKTATSLQSDNERLKLMLKRVQSGDKGLRATTSPSPLLGQRPIAIKNPSFLPHSRSRNESDVGAWPQLDPARLANFQLPWDPPSTSRYNSPAEIEEAHPLSARETWDLMQSHPLFLSGAVDVGEVCKRLKKSAMCDAKGLMFDEEQVRITIAEVGGSGSGELM